MAQHEEEVGDIELFIRLDGIAAALAVVFVAVVNGFFLQVAGVWAVVPVLALLICALIFADRALSSGRVLRSLCLIALGNGSVAGFVSLLLPFLWPVMILTIMMPLVLASPHLSRKQVVPAIVLAAFSTATVASVGLINDDGGVIEDLDDAVELVVVIGALAAQIVPIGLVVWQHNQMQRANVGSLQVLNADLIKSEAALAASRDRVVEAADTERRRIERDLHDGAQQRLVALGVRLRLLKSQAGSEPGAAENIDILIGELDDAIEEVRELAHGIYPPLLQIRGLPDALSAVARRSAQHVQVDLDPVGRLPERVETALYFTALEALTNAAKHAGDAAITMTLEEHDHDVMLRIGDDGSGFDMDEVTASHGFDNMRDRLAVVGGDLHIDAHPGVGTAVTATVPLPS